MRKEEEEIGRALFYAPNISSLTACLPPPRRLPPSHSHSRRSKVRETGDDERISERMNERTNERTNKRDVDRVHSAKLRASERVKRAPPL